jgi:MFS family permease
MALSNVALFGGSFLTPVFVGKITATLGWQWTFYFVAIFTAVALPFMIFFVPETAYRRPDHLNIDYNVDAVPSYDGAGLQESDNSDSKLPLGHEQRQSDDKEGRTVHREYSYWQTVKLFNGRKTDEDFWKLLLRPFPLFFHPGILWV